LPPLFGTTPRPIYSYDTGESPVIKQSDYDSVDVIPVSDPNASTMAQKVVTYQAALQLSQGAPQIYDLPYLHREMLEALGIKNVDKIVPLEDDMKPRDPVSENMDILNSKPVKAFLYQDHEAHLKVHMTAMQDPKLQAIIGQNPNAQMMQAALQAHIAEHTAFQYRIEIEKMLGVTLPPEDERLPEEVEVELSRSVAMAAEKLLQKDQAEAQQQKAQQQAQDPLLQLQMRQQELREAEFKHNAALEVKEFELKTMEAQAKVATENKRIDTQAEIAGAQISSKVEADKTSIANEQYIEGVKLGLKGISGDGNRQ
jgi:hypothetical protein